MDRVYSIMYSAVALMSGTGGTVRIVPQHLTVAAKKLIDWTGGVYLCQCASQVVYCIHWYSYPGQPAACWAMGRKGEEMDTCKLNNS